MEALDAKFHSPKISIVSSYTCVYRIVQTFFKSISDHSYVHNTCPQIIINY